jgi:nucleoside permease NupC
MVSSIFLSIHSRFGPDCWYILEFVAFDALTSQAKADPTFISQRAQLIASYALCGFGNLASGGISIGILAALAPNRMVDIVRLAPRALITGVIATLSTACIAGTCFVYSYLFNRIPQLTSFACS